MNLALPASLIFSNPQCELSEITLKELEIFQSARIPNSPDRIPQARYATVLSSKHLKWLQVLAL